MNAHCGLSISRRSMVCGLLAAAALACPLPFAAASECATPDWPLWDAWASRYVQEDGRMLASSMQHHHNTSEGQSYGMLFALIGNDRARFDRLWQWTRSNMMGTDIVNRLPGWLWGPGEDGQWRLQAANSASDADLWIVYALLEASRLWQRPDYRDQALCLLTTIESHLVVDLPGLGRLLLPGPMGFVLSDDLWRFNPSYLPLPLLRRLAKEAPRGPWQEIAANTVRMIRARSGKGYVADWIGYRSTSPDSGLFVADPLNGELGSYDAIRVYLWAGMTPVADPGFRPVLNALAGMAQATARRGVPPEKVQVNTGVTSGQAPFGFSAALIPYFIARLQPWLAEQQRRRVQQAIAAAFAAGNTPEYLYYSAHPEYLYYNVMLSLFALGWVEKRYAFRADGTLTLSWERP